MLTRNQNGGAKSKLFYHIFICHSDISRENRERLIENVKRFSEFSKLEFVDISNNRILNNIWERLEFRNHFSKEVLFKIFLGYTFKNIDKIIVSDVDVVFLGDVSESFINFSCDEDIYIAGVRANNPSDDFSAWRAGYKKFSSDEFQKMRNGVGGGYLIANLKKWREDNLSEKLISCALTNAHRLVLSEQDVLNLVCSPKIATLSPAHIVCHANWETYGENWEKLIPNVYSKSELDDARKNTIQLHFVGANKPWNAPKTPKSDVWFRYLCKTNFLDIFLKNLESTIIARYIRTTKSYRVKKYIKNNPFFIIQSSFYVKSLKKLRARFI